jgi:hypothetical protein
VFVHAHDNSRGFILDGPVGKVMQPLRMPMCATCHNFPYHARLASVMSVLPCVIWEKGRVPCVSVMVVLRAHIFCSRGRDVARDVVGLATSGLGAGSEGSSGRGSHRRYSEGRRRATVAAVYNCSIPRVRRNIISTDRRTRSLHQPREDHRRHYVTAVYS